MPSPFTPVRLLASLAALGSLAVPAGAHARPVAESDFKITYRFLDDDGTPSTIELGPDDLGAWVNRARCQCGEAITARVALQRSNDGPYDDQGIRTFVGTTCDQGQNNFGSMTRPCVQMLDGRQTDYDDGGVDVIFPLVWLSSRVPDLEHQPVALAEPVDPCAEGQIGESGVWLCAENGMQTGCQADEFIIRGTTSTNAGMGSTGATGGTGGTTGDGTTTSGGITFDYQAPQVTVTGFKSSPGDGAVVISWDRVESTQVHGYRVLCADADGNPVEGKEGASEPSFTQRSAGQLYYTAENLCPGAIVYEGSASVDVPVDDSSGSSSGGSDSTGVGADQWLGDEWSQATTGTTGTGGSSTGGDSTGAVTSTGDATGSSDTGGSDTAGTGDSGGGGGSGSSPLTSLDWAYVCSGHITGTGTYARIEGLENGKTYQFIVVAYDRAGNPVIVSGADPMFETPEATTNFWEQCEMQGDLCGSGGFCQCRTGDDANDPMGWLGSGLLLVVMAGLRRRSRA